MLTALMEKQAKIFKMKIVVNFVCRVCVRGMKEFADRESVIHFELYRRLKDSVCSSNFPEGIKFDVEPEFPVEGKSADLLVKAVLNGSTFSLLVLEVKRWTKDGLPLFSSLSENQVKEYAKSLHTVYYAITDGQRFRLFETSSDELIGNYKLSDDKIIDENVARQLLEGLVNICKGKTSKLPFSTFEDPTEKIKEVTSGFSRILINLFDELSGSGLALIEKSKNVWWINIGSYWGIIKIGIYKETSKNYITIQLEILKEVLGIGKTSEMLTKLSKIPGFQWVSERIDFSKPFIWTYIRDVIIEEPDFNRAKEELRKWILELNEALRQ
jgi:hypothetical protein